MITKVFYWINGNNKFVWQTTYSDRLYSEKSRRHLITRTKPTESQIRNLHKQYEKFKEVL